MESLGSYRALNNKYKSFASKEIFLANMTPVCKVRKDLEGEPIPGSEFVVFQHKIYWRSKKPQDVERITLDLDKRVYQEHNLVRSHLQWYNAKGEIIPLEEQSLRPGDVICIDAGL